MNSSEKQKLSPEQLQRKYHQNLVFNYAEYPTCDHWDYNFRSDEYKKSLIEWLKKNPKSATHLQVFLDTKEYAKWLKDGMK